MYLELFVKKYKEAMLLNLDICMKKALQQLNVGSLESVMALQLDTYFANPEQLDEAKKSIKKIYELQMIDFRQFSSKQKDIHNLDCNLRDDLLTEIARADPDNKAREEFKFSGGHPCTRMLCNETLDLSINPVNEIVNHLPTIQKAAPDKERPSQNPLNKRDIARRPEDKQIKARTKESSPWKRRFLYDKKPSQDDRSREKESEATDNSNLDLIAQLDIIIKQKGTKKGSLPEIFHQK